MPSPPFTTAGEELTAEAAALRQRLEHPDAADPAPSSWADRDVDSLAACIADPAAADASRAVVALAWVGAWLHHVAYLADRARIRSQEATEATSHHWWAGSRP